MKKHHTFSRYIFLVLLILQSLTLIVVAGVLHALLVRSIDREYHNEINTKMAEFRYFLKDRQEQIQTRLEELSANNGIKVALMLEMADKVIDVVTSMYPAANGVTYYICNTSDVFLPAPSKEHLFLTRMSLKSRLESDQATLQLNPSGRPTLSVFIRPIVRKESFLGQAVGVYDLAVDRDWAENLQTYSNYRLFREAPEGLVDIKAGLLLPCNDQQKSNLGKSNAVIRVENFVVMALEGYPHLYWAADTMPLAEKKRQLTTNILLLCIPLLGLALTASFMIVKKVTSPLNYIAEDARQITHGASGHYLDENKIKHIEFLELAKALNKALARIQRRNEQLVQLNRELQDEIGERKQLSEALAKREKQIRTLQDNIPIGLFRTTPEGRMIYANPAGLNIFGYRNLDEIQHVDFKDLYEHQTDRRKTLDQLNEHGIIEGMRVRLRRKDGKLFWAELHIKKVTGAHPGKIYLDGTVQDISLQIEAQNEKKQLEDQLRHAQKMETIGTLAGGIAHDFNNILASITGYSELALEDSQPDTIQRENLKCVLIAAQRAADLVGQILTFARQTDTEKIAVKVHVVLEEALKLLHSTLPSTIKIEKHIRTTSAVMAAPSQLHQVIVNLCSNASHAMQSTGGVLTIELAEIELDRASLYAGHLVSGGPYVKLRISDTGHGMAPDIMERIFDPYFTTKKPGEGTGIGLSVVQGIVRAHGGFLSAESHPGKGATFNVFLPRIDNKELPRTPQASRIVGGKERILLVDDENHIVYMGQQILERLGYRVTPCSKATEAFELFKASPDQFDLVIADITMPQMTGDLLAKKITAIRPEMPIILWTGHTDRLGQIESSKSGANAIVYKPMSKSKLAKTIREVLSGHNGTQ